VTLVEVTVGEPVVSTVNVLAGGAAVVEGPDNHDSTGSGVDVPVAANVAVSGTVLVAGSDVAVEVHAASGSTVAVSAAAINRFIA
jgi:hypothetical protein